MMMTQICDIVCERILMQSTGCAYNTFGIWIDGYRRVSDFGLVLKARLGVFAEILDVFFSWIT